MSCASAGGTKQSAAKAPLRHTLTNRGFITGYLIDSTGPVRPPAPARRTLFTCTLAVMPRLVIATTNQHKIARNSRAARRPSRSTSSRSAAWPGSPVAEESGATFEENARAKALYYAAITGELTVAEDSGLEVDALGGRPGVESARFGGPDASVSGKIRPDLRRDRAIRIGAIAPRDSCAPSRSRKATMCCSKRAARLKGRLRPQPQGTAGFGYDPIFFYPPWGITLAEAGGRKGLVSHRGKAFRALGEFLAVRS